MERFFIISGNLKLVGYVQLGEQPLIQQSSGGNCSFSCRMTFHEFNCLSFYRQKTLVHGRGDLATRWQEGAVGLLCLMLQGFFAEIVYSTDGTASQYVFAFDTQSRTVAWRSTPGSSSCQTGCWTLNSIALPKQKEKPDAGLK